MKEVSEDLLEPIGSPSLSAVPEASLTNIPSNIPALEAVPESQLEPIRKQAEAPGHLLGVGRSLAQGLAADWWDEIEAGLMAAIGEGTYKENRDRIRAEIAAYRAQNPALSTGFEVLGSLAVPGSIGARIIGKGGQQALRIYLRSKATADAHNVISGAGAGEDLDDATEKAAQMLIQGQGFTTPAAAAPALVSRVRGPAQMAADRSIRRSIRKEGIDGASDLQSLGPRGMVADVGNAPPAMLENAVTKNIEANRIRQAMDRRQQQVARDTQAELLPQGRRNITSEKATQRAAGKALDNAYEASERAQRTVDVREVVQSIFDSFGNIDPSVNPLESRLVDLMMRHAPTGITSPKRAQILINSFEEATKNLKAGTPMYARGTRAIRDLRDSVYNSLPEVGEAADRYARVAAANKAPKIASKVMDKSDVGELLDELGSKRPAYREALAAYLPERLAVTADTSAPATFRKNITADHVQEKLKAVLGEEGARKVTKLAIRNHRMQSTKNRVTGGSQTAPRQQAAKDMEPWQVRLAGPAGIGGVGGAAAYGSSLVSGVGDPAAGMLVGGLLAGGSAGLNASLRAAKNAQNKALIRRLMQQGPEAIDFLRGRNLPPRGGSGMPAGVGLFTTGLAPYATESLFGGE